MLILFRNQQSNLCPSKRKWKRQHLGEHYLRLNELYTFQANLMNKQNKAIPVVTHALMLKLIHLYIINLLITFGAGCPQRVVILSPKPPHVHAPLHRNLEIWATTQLRQPLYINSALLWEKWWSNGSRRRIMWNQPRRWKGRRWLSRRNLWKRSRNIQKCHMIKTMVSVRQIYSSQWGRHIDFKEVLYISFLGTFCIVLLFSQNSPLTAVGWPIITVRTSQNSFRIVQPCE